jgi:hypothetical protein
MSIELILLVVPWARKSLVLDPGVLHLLPALMKLWQAIY